ncbi:MAG TPA: glycine cleavage system aminomethyltransferase GcvT [Betaproteobacteria bacterium]|nr:glycine cleavage system aminomethyltransferase GcvT [Betaproteobacteria bacterium]
MLKTTPLHQSHRRMGAKMADFAGWEMPIHYGSQIDEHHRVRRAAGMFDVSHMQVIDLHGKETRGFLRQLAANNIDKLTLPGKALYSCLLNEHGGVIDDLIIYFMAEDWFRLVVNAATADKDIAWISRHRNRLAPLVDIRPRLDLAMIAVQGPDARTSVWQSIPGAQAATEGLRAFQAATYHAYFIARTGYTGEDGFEIILPAGEAAALWTALHTAGVAPAGLGARDTLRLEAGMSLYGQDMDETTSPLEAGLAWTVDLASPRDFIGKAALQSQPPTRHMVGLLLLGKGVLRSHQPIITAHGEGEITSGGFSPTLGRAIGLARAPLGVAPGDKVTVDIRGKHHPAKAVNYPFVRHGQPCYRER